MELLIENIRTALSANASAEAKAAGSGACRAILAAIEAEPGKPIALPGVDPRPASPLSNMSADQFFDVLIAKLKTMVHAKGATPAPTTRNAAGPLRIPMIVLPPAK